MAHRLLSGLTPPTSSTDPRETMLWVRRMEIISGLLSIAGGFLWFAGWSRWLLIGLGLMGLSPWPGAQAILRKADRNPDVLISDPERRRARAQRAMLIQVALSLVIGLVVGYVADGWPVAIFTGVFLGVVGGLTAWLFLRRWNSA